MEIDSVNEFNINYLKSYLKEHHSNSTPLKLCIASKYATSKQIENLYSHGFRTFGENKIQNGIQKIQVLSHLKNVEWHFIGHLQTNKVQRALEYFNVIQSIDTLKLLSKIDMVSNRLNKKTTGYIQINSGNDPKKFGFSIENIYKIKNKIFSFSNVNIQGIMIMVPHTNNENDLKKVFKDSFDLYKKLKNEFNINHLSMGMSQDYKLAVMSGSTMIRIGRMLFT
jgi:PLP dependent protein